MGLNDIINVYISANIVVILLVSMKVVSMNMKIVRIMWMRRR